MEKRTVPPALQSLLEWDKKITKDVFTLYHRKFDSPNHRQVLKALEISCHGIPWIGGVIAALYCFGSPFDLWVNLLVLLLVDVAIVALTKAFTRRRRPAYNQDDMFATHLVDKFSFPSGHATRAIAVACFFCWLYPLPFLLRLPVMAWSLAVAVSRVLLGRHHVLDVTAGIAIGFVEYVIMCVIWIGPETAAAWAQKVFDTEDPWSSA